MNGEHSASATKTVIGTAIIHRSDPILTQSRRTHNARFDSYVDVRFAKYGKRMTF